MTMAADLIKAIEALTFGIAWRVPWLTMIAPHVTYRVTDRVPTLAITPKGTCYVNPGYFQGLDESTRRGALIHEWLHNTLTHEIRRGDRDRRLWNEAADMAINAILARLSRETGGWIQVGHDWLFPPADLESASAEELYDHLVQEQGGQQGQQGQGGQQGQQGHGPGGSHRTHCSAAPDDSDGEGGGQGENEAGADGDVAAEQAHREARKWAEVAAQVAQAAREAGTESGDLAASAFTPPPPRVRWSEVLRHGLAQALSLHSREDVTWKRRSRRTQPSGPIFPGQVGYKATAAVVIDASGSMFFQESDGLRSYQRAIVETCAIVQAVGVRTLLVVHDVGVAEPTPLWLKPGCKVPQVTAEALQRVGGGTVFDYAYQAVAESGQRFDTLIHLTDGCVGSWPALPRNCRHGIAALLGFADDSLVPHGWRKVDATLK